VFTLIAVQQQQSAVRQRVVIVSNQAVEKQEDFHFCALYEHGHQQTVRLISTEVSLNQSRHSKKIKAADSTAFIPAL